MTKPFATIDIGTNSVLLLIAEYREGALSVVRDEARITGLGRGLRQTFHPESKARTLKALQEYAAIIQQFSCQKVFCVGTAAFRKAEDGKNFIQEISDKFGWQTRILSGEEEAQFSYLSVERDFSDHFPNLVALDIGGGSTEIISKNGGVSLDLGTVTLTERYFANMEEEIDNQLKSSSPPSPPLTLVALAGTATTLSSINQKLGKWDPGKIQGSVITLPELDSMIELLQSTTHKERRRIPGMVPGREDTILAGALILKAVMKKLKVDQVIVSDRGVRYGLFYREFS